ncbi:MAG: hypothetical protein BYD32DRAFT_407996 [Podila humilis]|nr:MAG: hypothetical protein BYD32DRAFT_407996 [Podila humilis]
MNVSGYAPYGRHHCSLFFVLFFYFMAAEVHPQATHRIDTMLFLSTLLCLSLVMFYFQLQLG